MSRLSCLPVVTALAAACVFAACGEARVVSPAPPVYRGDVDALLREHCQTCHGPDRAEAGYRVDSYVQAIGCSDPGRGPVVVPPAERAQLLWTLRFDQQHADLLPSDAYRVLSGWVQARVPLRTGGIHGGDILRPGAPGFHGALAAQNRHAPLVDADDVWACGRCHEDAPAGDPPAAGVPGATACTACHTQPGGALACGTCHGVGERGHPPRDPCFHDDPRDAHAAHLTDAVGLRCDSCHPTADATLRGTHGDGQVDVRFALAEPLGDGRYNAETGRCAVYCHQRGGTDPEPSWLDGPMAGCQSCHASPPAEHYPGPCTSCHPEASPDGTDLSPGPQHLNGSVDLGSGVGCGACHGSTLSTATDPGPGELSQAWPDTPSHRAHGTTLLTDRVRCASCHPVPRTVEAEGHLDREELTAADVLLDPELSAPDTGADPSYSDGGCDDLVCHPSAGVDSPHLVWDQPAELGCTGCHGAPPPPPHPPDEGCAQLICHGDEVGFDRAGGPAITERGRRLHMDGEVQAEAP